MAQSISINRNQLQWNGTKTWSYRYRVGNKLRLLLPWMHNYSETVQDALMLTLYLGLRSGEVCELRNEWLTEEDDGLWITIPARDMKKNHSDHRVPIDWGFTGDRPQANEE